MAGESLKGTWVVISRAFRQFYDQLGMVVFLSITWFLLGFGPGAYFSLMLMNQVGLFAVLVAIIGLSLISGPVTAAIYAGAHYLVTENTFNMRELWRAFRVHYKSAAKATAVMLVILVVLLIDVAWFMQYKSGFIRWLGYFWWYLVILWGLMGIYVFPFIVYKPILTRDVLKKAVLMALDNLVISIFAMALTGGVIYICIRLRAPLVFLMAGFISLLHMVTFLWLMDKYEDEPADDQS